MSSRYVKYLAIAAWAAWAMVPVVAQAQLVDLGVATGYAINNSGQVALSTGIYSEGKVTALPALQAQRFQPRHLRSMSRGKWRGQRSCTG